MIVTILVDYSGKKRLVFRCTGRFVLNEEEIKIVNARCQKVMFSVNETGCKGNIFERLSILKNTHAWIEVS